MQGGVQWWRRKWCCVCETQSDDVSSTVVGGAEDVGLVLGIGLLESHKRVSFVFFLLRGTLEYLTRLCLPSLACHFPYSIRSAMSIPPRQT
jgi:hypothetical protein